MSKEEKIRLPNGVWVKLPQLPNFLISTGADMMPFEKEVTVSLKDLPKGYLEHIGKSWTDALVKKHSFKTKP